jgi:hypothetical protein
MSSYKDRILEEFGVVPNLPRGHNYKNAYIKLSSSDPRISAFAAVTYIVPRAFPDDCSNLSDDLLNELLNICIYKYSKTSGESKIYIDNIIDAIIECSDDIPINIIFELGATENIEVLSKIYNHYTDERSHEVWSDAIRGAVRANNLNGILAVVRTVVGGIYDYDAINFLVEDAATEAARINNIPMLKLLRKTFRDEMNSLFEEKGVDMNDKINSFVSIVTST